ncbi:hypothetical protein GGR56DRAFT_460314 [Xylariaceae sp. FL0804]|nr:hypothetical protein GGR56DRAFT_460314 [Xylariaceae sp. FL0804]
MSHPRLSCDRIDELILCRSSSHTGHTHVVVHRSDFGWRNVWICSVSPELEPLGSNGTCDREISGKGRCRSREAKRPMRWCFVSVVAVTLLLSSLLFMCCLGILATPQASACLGSSGEFSVAQAATIVGGHAVRTTVPAVHLVAAMEWSLQIETGPWFKLCRWAAQGCSQGLHQQSWRLAEIASFREAHAPSGGGLPTEVTGVS